MVVAVALLLVTVAAQRVRSADAAHAQAQTQLIATTADVQLVHTLRAQRQTAAEQRRPEQDVIAQVNDTLAQAGIPADRFGSLRPESDGAVEGDAAGLYRRQALRLTLQRVTLDQVGGFLAQWRDGQPLWTPTRLELTHRADTRRRRADPGALPAFDLHLVLTAIYVAEESP